jgi:hypothetical protein
MEAVKAQNWAVEPQGKKNFTHNNTELSLKIWTHFVSDIRKKKLNAIIKLFSLIICEFLVRDRPILPIVRHHFRLHT